MEEIIASLGCVGAIAALVGAATANIPIMLAGGGLGVLALLLTSFQKVIK